MLQCLELGSAERDRLTAKFSEKNCDSIKTLIKLRKSLLKDDNEDVTDRLLQIDVILSWLMIEFKDFKRLISKKLDINHLKTDLEEYINFLDSEDETNKQLDLPVYTDKDPYGTKNTIDMFNNEVTQTTLDMLQTLVSQFLEEK